MLHPPKSQRIILFRVEHESTRVGPFMGNGALGEAVADHAERFPPPMGQGGDCPRFVAGTHLCAVSRIELIQEWFGPFRQQLLAAGFGLYEYRPLRRNIVRSRSGTQVGFAPYPASPRRAVFWPE